MRAVASSAGPATATCKAPRTSTKAKRVSSPGKRSSDSVALSGTRPSAGNFTGMIASVSDHGAISTACDSRLSPASAKTVTRRGSPEKFRTRQTRRASCPATGRAGSSARPARPVFAASPAPAATRVTRIEGGTATSNLRHALAWKSEQMTSSRSPSAAASCFTASASAPARSPGSACTLAWRSDWRRKSRFGPGSGSADSACARSQTRFAREPAGSVASTSSAAAVACARRVRVPSAKPIEAVASTIMTTVRAVFPFPAKRESSHGWRNAATSAAIASVRSSSSPRSRGRRTRVTRRIASRSSRSDGKSRVRGRVREKRCASSGTATSGRRSQSGFWKRTFII